jgi:hypothetical protein
MVQRMLPLVFRCTTPRIGAVANNRRQFIFTTQQ